MVSGRPFQVAILGSREVRREVKKFTHKAERIINRLQKSAPVAESLFWPPVRLPSSATPVFSLKKIFTGNL